MPAIQFGNNHDVENRGCGIMEEKGFVVCLLKYMLGSSYGNSEYWDTESENKKPVALGYFGRVDVVSVSQFREYMNVASTYNAEFAGSRKQLLLYPLMDGHPKQIDWKPFDSDDGGCLPFQPAMDSRRPCFCCLSILNISQSVKDSICGRDYAGGIRRITQCLLEQLNTFIQEQGENAWLPHAVMGLLGTEDLCLISLSDNFDLICRGVNHLRRLTFEGNGEFIIENSHSIQLVDFSDKALEPQWGETTAEIHFSLKTTDGLTYIKKVQNAIEAHASGQKVSLESQIGEYDAVIRCPASALGEYLYGYRRVLNYSTAEYRKSAYQSETLLYQKTSLAPIDRISVDLSWEHMASTPKANAVHSGKRIANGMGAWMQQPVEEIKRCIQEFEAHPGNEYVTQVLYRLLKDFMHIVSIPFGGPFQRDLCVQFQATIHAVECAAQQYQRLAKEYGIEARNRFDRNFPQIIDAMSNSMQAASQIDRLYFEEQQSHLQNTGAYHKVLLAYYGIVKVLIQFVYSISRKADSSQPILIPLLSFGYAQIICSKAFDTTYEGKPARLLCITLPYQALSNVPKYIGPLTHEIFHYSTPVDRTLKNKAAGKCLTAVAFRCFLNQVGIAFKCAGQSGSIVFNQYRTDFMDTVSEMFDIIWRNLLEQFPRKLMDGQQASYGESGEPVITSEAFFQCMRTVLSPPLRSPIGNPTELLYCEGWLELRKRLKEKAGGDPYTAALFALNEDWDDQKAREFIQDAYQSGLSQTACEIPAYLGIYEMALREVPPDLFDIGLVMWGKSDEDRAKQYLWQIHSIRSDKLYYGGSPDGKLTEPIPFIDGNHIRFGIVLDYLTFGLIDNVGVAAIDARLGQVGAALQRWCSGEGLSQSQKIELEKNYKAISGDYSKYHEDSLFANVLFRDYIAQVEEQLRRFSDITDKTDLTHLSTFYGEYCAVLGAIADDKERSTALFDLSLRLIEFYQCQPELSNLSELCGKSLPLTGGPGPKGCVDGVYNAQKCEVTAFGPEELSAKIVEIYDAMRLSSPAAPLWFRGQRLEKRTLLPSITRDCKKDGFLPGMRKMLTLAKAKILPQGEGFHRAEWLALLQHYEFKTNLLDWSEDLHSALFFAIERWIENPDRAKEGNASISVLNPILYNLARDMLEKERKKGNGKEANKAFEQSVSRLSDYLMGGDDGGEEYGIPLFTSSEDNEEYKCYFDLDIDREVDISDICLPIAAMTSANSDRMKRQAGVFTFCDVRSRPTLDVEGGKYTYDTYDLANIQKSYFNCARESGIKHPTPFLFKLILSATNADAFVRYVRAIGMRKYRMYPELNNLAQDIMLQSL